MVSFAVALSFSAQIFRALAVAASPAQFSSDVTAIRTITIRSAWGGLAPSQAPPLELVIRREPDGFFADGSKIDTGLIEALVSAFRKPSLPAPKIFNLQISQEWLNENVEVAGERSVRYRDIFSSSAHAATYRAAFTNYANIERLLPSLFSTIHTDDYPRVEAVIVFKGGEMWSASSNSQNAFMIPWQVNSTGHCFTTFDADLSRSVGALMPAQSVNRDRLLGESFAFQLGEAVMAHIEEAWIAPALAPIRREYVIERAEIELSHSIDYGKEWADGHPQEENALLLVRRDGWPQYFRARLILPFRSETVSVVDEFLKQSSHYESLFLSVPWLNRFLEAHPQAIELRFVHGRSFSQKAMTVFAADMLALGKDGLVRQVRAVQSDVALVVVQDQGYWLILPDKRMICWRFRSPAGLLKLTAGEFPASECAEYLQIAAQCAGLVIAPDGTILK
ncbi:MAG: hypothetical protein U0Q18_27765 [Bryobacteraceae bacterium]